MAGRWHMGRRHLGRLRQGIVPMLATALLLALSACGNASPAARSSATATAVRATPTATVALGGQLVSWTVVTNIPANAVYLRFAPSDARIAYLCAEDPPAQGNAVTGLPHLYTRIDGGQTWEADAPAPALVPVSRSLSGHGAACHIFVDAHDARDVFYEVVENDFVSVTHSIARALYRSRDCGATWQQLAEVRGTDSSVDITVLGARLIAQLKPHWPRAYGHSDPH